MTIAKREKIQEYFILKNLSRLKQIYQSHYYNISALILGDSSQFYNLKLDQLALNQYPFCVMIIGKKKLKSAVKRNYIRRKFSEAYKKARTIYKNKLNQQYYAFVFYLNSNILDCSFEALASDIYQALHRISIK